MEQDVGHLDSQLNSVCLTVVMLHASGLWPKVNSWFSFWDQSETGFQFGLRPQLPVMKIFICILIEVSSTLTLNMNLKRGLNPTGGARPML